MRTSRVAKIGNWEKALTESADQHRAKACGQQFAMLMPDYFTSISPAQSRVLAALFSGSRALSEMLITQPQRIEMVALNRLENPRRIEGLRREVQTFLEPALASGDYSGASANSASSSSAKCYASPHGTWLASERSRKSSWKSPTSPMCAFTLFTRLPFSNCRKNTGSVRARPRN